MIPNGRPFHWMRCQCLKTHWQCFKMILKWFATHFGSIEKHCQCFKTQWKCFSMHFQRVENALQRKNATTLFSLSPLFPNRVTFMQSRVPLGPGKFHVVVLVELYKAARIKLSLANFAVVYARIRSFKILKSFKVKKPSMYFFSLLRNLITRLHLKFLPKLRKSCKTSHFVDYRQPTVL